MARESNPQIEMLKLAAAALGPLLDDLVFVGGATACLYVQEGAAEEMRTTEDVDCIVQIASPVAFAKLEEKLRKLGLKNSTERGAPLCRWLAGELVIDVMPTDPKILGFSNRWYLGGIKNKIAVDLGGVTVHVMPFPYFLASKVEAFSNRGAADPRFSKDLEDIVLVLDGNKNPLNELNHVDADLRAFIAETFNRWMADPEIREAVAAFIPANESKRAKRVLEVMRSLSYSNERTSAK